MNGDSGAACYHRRVSPDSDQPASGLAEEAEWVARARAGEVQAFERLYRGHVGRMYALCLRMCGNALEAEEMVQEAFVRAWEKLGTFRGDSAFASWLHRLTVNVVLGAWRSRGRRREQVVAMDDAASLTHPSHEPQPRHRVDLERAIGELPTGARTIFVLHDVEGYTHRELAELTGLAEGTCKAQLHRARRLLRGRLSTTGREPESARGNRMSRRSK